MNLNDWLLFIMQIVGPLVRLCIALPLLFWVIKKIDSINNTDVDAWWSKSDAQSQAIYLSVRLAVVAMLLAFFMA
ncbi:MULTISPECIES: hypothetical protein [Aeromonas]|jgi:hypothetical protein|uniref:hypothetical protein n=1 Tax=Aeromonas TaxID=642 RepID=UPI000390FDAD|nr:MULTISPECIES: hypothetical protein [Aeromonas]MBL0523212.1 hypothetical protein [Aeromonas enteropelogenes]QMS78821.1 hypothetical protein M001_021830 [Aeromonas veronii Hm21]